MTAREEAERCEPPCPAYGIGCACSAALLVEAHDARVRADERRRVLEEVEERLDALNAETARNGYQVSYYDVRHLLRGMAEAAEADSRPVAAPVSAEQPETAPGAARGRESATGAES